MNNHSLCWERFDQGKRLIWGAIQPGVIVARVKDHRHPVGMDLLGKLIGRGCDHGGGHHLAIIIIAICAFECAPDASQRKWWPFLVTVRSGGHSACC